MSRSRRPSTQSLGHLFVRFATSELSLMRRPVQPLLAVTRVKPLQLHEEAPLPAAERAPPSLREELLTARR
ncbi:MAG TPA: hypothetical protein VFN67_14880 [Polyangiales bacterium]|nr:hypothetical protein [Polyangiales bacterium]